KKLRVLLSMAIVCGVALAASAQPIPFMLKDADEIAHRTQKKAMDAQRKANQLINKIQQEGKDIDIRYTFLVFPEQKNANGSSWEIRRTCEVSNVWKLNDADNKTVSFLLNRSDWEKMYTDCMPSETNRVLYNDAGHRSQQIIETWHNGYLGSTYTHTSEKGKIALLTHKHYMVNGKKYTVITLKKQKK
ncbi:MAG: hypothetical protein J5601_02920, partial [Elusimicrobiaceae bacterium]|nr:hypothetical protein [Elusimicrobiaceae bacterium]